MAKARLLRPEFWTDERVVKLSPLSRLLFLGMWNQACDNGHLDDSALQLKMRVLPADDVNVAEMLEDIIESGMVVRRDGYLKVVNLSEHQPLDLRFLVFCDHCDEDPESHYDRSQKKPRHGQHQGSTRAAPERPSSARRSGGVDVDVDGYTKEEAKPDRFAEFWDAYPRKIGRGQAEKAWKAATKKADAQAILDGLKAALPTLKAAEQRFIPHPTTWLNGERWDDDLTPAAPTRARGAMPEGW